MSLGIWQIAIIAIVILVVFGRGRLPAAMGDLAKGIKEFKKGLADDKTDEPENQPINITEQKTVDDEHERK